MKYVHDLMIHHYKMYHKNEKDNPESNDKENIFDHNDQTVDCKKAD